MVLALAPVNFAHKTKQTNKTFGIELFPQNLSPQHRLYIYQEPNNKACPSKDIERKNKFKICVIMNEIIQVDNNFG